MKNPELQPEGLQEATRPGRLTGAIRRLATVGAIATLLSTGCTKDNEEDCSPTPIATPDDSTPTPTEIPSPTPIEIPDECSDGDADTLAYEDKDNDGHGSSEIDDTIVICNDDTIPAGYVDSSDDCNDYNESAYPGAAEILDGTDNNCDGEVDEGFAKEVLRFETFDTSKIVLDLTGNENNGEKNGSVAYYNLDGVDALGFEQNNPGTVSITNPNLQLNGSGISIISAVEPTDLLDNNGVIVYATDDDGSVYITGIEEEYNSPFITVSYGDGYTESYAPNYQLPLDEFSIVGVSYINNGNYPTFRIGDEDGKIIAPAMLEIDPPAITYEFDSSSGKVASIGSSPDGTNGIDGLLYASSITNGGIKWYDLEDGIDEMSVANGL